jgi:hypothetical protein
LDDGARWTAVEKGLLDYDASGSWDRTSDESRQAVKARGETVLTGRPVEAAKIKGGELIGKWRYTPKGFGEDLDPAERESPTASKSSHRILETMSMAKRWVGFLGDISSAFFRGKSFVEIMEEENAKLIEQGKPPTATEKILWVDVPEAEGPKKAWNSEGQRMCRRLLREVPGTRKAPVVWWRTFTEWLCEQGFVRSKLDPCVYYMPAQGDDPDEPWMAYLALHVDDFRGRGTSEFVEWFEMILASKYDLGGTWRTFDPSKDDETIWSFLGEDWVMSKEGTRISQEKYVQDKIHPVELSKAAAKDREARVSDELESSFRTVLGAILWVTGRTRFDAAYEASFAASRVGAKDLRIKDVMRLNKVVRYLRATTMTVWLPVMEKIESMTVLVDAGESETTDLKWEKAQTGVVLLLTDSKESAEASNAATIGCVSQSCRRVTHTSFDAETVSAITAVDLGISMGLLCAEFRSGRRLSRRQQIEAKYQGISVEDRGWPVAVHTDSNSLVTKVYARRVEPKLAKRRKQDIGDLQECLEMGELTEIIHTNGLLMPPDCLTKCASKTQATTKRLMDICVSGWYEPILGGEKTALTAWVQEKQQTRAQKMSKKKAKGYLNS